MIAVPTTPEFPDYEEVVDLGGTVYSLRFVWNDRDASWFLTVETTAGAVLVSGAKIRARWPVLARFRDPRLPAGQIVAVQSSTRPGVPAEPGRLDLGADYALVFATTAEVATLPEADVLSLASGAPLPAP